MIDREKLIKAFECHQIQENTNAWNCVGCPYIWTDDCTEQMAKDALELLKEYIIPNFMKLNPECEDCLPEGIEDCIECHKRQEGR